MLSNGTRLAGRYEIVQQIGGGGMATVYRARDRMLDRWVAVKVMNESLRDQKEFVQRFIREAKAAGSLSHPNVVNVYDIGLEGTTYYMVMEYIEGVTLAEYLEKKGPLSPEEATEIAIQICDGLIHAHHNKIVHRDIKLQNIMRANDNRYKVTDFGISFFSHIQTNLTQTGTVMGSAHYFSPEQASGGKVSYPSDLYSLGILLYKLVTGVFPFDSEHSVSIALMHLQHPVPDPRQFNPNLAEPFTQVLLRMLEKNPDDRYQTADDVKQAFKLIQHQPVESTSVIENNHGSEGPYYFDKATSQILPPRQKIHQEKENKISLPVWIGSFVVLLVLLIIFAYQWDLFAADEEPKPEIAKQTNTVKKKPIKQPTSKSIQKKIRKPKLVEGKYRWWRELPKSEYRENDIFHDIKVTGKNGDYEVSLQVGLLPNEESRFHYNIYVVDSFSSRRIFYGQEVNLPTAPSEEGMAFRFPVKIPTQLLPSTGLLKIEIFRFDESKKVQDPTDTILQQWGKPPTKESKKSSLKNKD